MSVLLVSADLATSSKVAAAAARRGVELATARDAESIAQRAATCGAMIALVDLSLSGMDVGAVVAALRDATPSAGAQPPRIVAFGPHVHEALLAAARDAGCDVVLSRGAFFAQLDQIVAGQLDD